MQYAGIISAFIQEKLYLEFDIAREYVVTVTFHVSKQGTVLFSRVKQNSGDGRIDALALETLRQNAQLPRPPADLEQSDLIFSIPISYDKKV